MLRTAGFVLGVLGLGAALSAFVARDASLHAAVRFLRAAGAPAALGVTLDRPDADYANDLAPAFDRLRIDVLRLSLFVLAAWAALEWTRRALRKQEERRVREADSPESSIGSFDPAGTAGLGPALELAAARFSPASRFGGPRVAMLVVAAIVIADLGAFFLRTNQPVLRAGLFPPTPALELLHRESGKSRFARVSADETAAMGDVDTLLVPNIGMIHDLTDAQGYRDLVPGRVLRLLEGTSVKVGTGGATGVALSAAKSPVLDIVSARWLIAARPLPETEPSFQESGLKRVETGSPPGRDVVVYENPGALPLAYAVHEAVVMNDAEGLDAIKGGAFDATKKVALDRLPAEARTGDSGPSPDEVVAARFESDAIRVDATLSAPGFVVVGASWDPGWRATLWHGPWQEDRGQDLEIVRANVAFMAVWVPKGKHTIELRYWPRALSFGIGIAGGGALILLALLVWPTRRRPPEQEAAPGT
jgi:hypothetical protein